MEIEETGTVTQVTDGRAAVRIEHRPSPECGGCTVCRPAGPREFVVWLDAANLKPGDRVRLAVPVPGPWRGIMLVFGLPLAAIMAGLLVGSEWTALQSATGLTEDAAAVVLAAALGGTAFLVALLSERRFSRRHRPRVLEVLASG